MSDFLGRGWTFPPKVDEHGMVALAVGEEDIAQAILIILRTPIGQRVMRPTFGSRLHELIFAVPHAQTFGLAEMYVRDALVMWEPRIDVVDVHAACDPADHAVLLIKINYRVKATHAERSLVHPFYRIPGE